MRSRLKIRKKDFYMFLLLLPIFEPVAIQVMFSTTLHRGFLLLKVMSSLYIFYLYHKKNNRMMSKSLICWVIFFVYILGNTYYQGNITNNFLVGCLSMMAIIVFINLHMDDPKALMDVFLFIAEILVYLNFLTMVLFPSGLYASSATSHTENWLLGYDNFFEVTFIPALILALIHCYLYRSYIRTFFLILVIHVSAAISLPSTLILCLAFIDILYFLGIYRLRKVLNINVLVISLSLLAVGIVFFNIQSKYGAFIFNLFGKDATFSNRTYLWEKVLLQISQSLLFGYGFSDGEYRYIKMGQILIGGYNCHNQYLEFLWEGGIIFLSIFAVCTFFGVRKISRTKSLRTSQIFTLGIGAFFLIFIDKAHIQMCPPFFFALWELAYYTEEIESSRKKSPKNM